MILETFEAGNRPLMDVNHPSKPALVPVEEWPITPSEELWANKYHLYRFGEEPGGEQKSGGSVSVVSGRECPTPVADLACRRRL